MSDAPDNVVDFVPPEASNGPMPPTDDIEKMAPTVGEALVGRSFNPSADFNVDISKLRGSRTIDLLLNLPLRMIQKPDGAAVYDSNHRMIIEEAVRRQMDATMWAVKALTWKG